MITPEFMTIDLIDDGALTHSSEKLTLPAENVQSPFRTKFWQSLNGRNVVAGINDKIDFDDGGGEENATLTAGNYSTDALYAAEVQTRMDALTADNITISYSSVTRKFTFDSDGATFELLCNSGTNAGTSAYRDVGFDVSTDKTGGVSYTSDDESRCSREWIGIGLDVATLAKRFSIVSHNFSSSAVVTLYRHTSDDLPNATAVGVVTYDADFMVLEFSATYKFWWIHIEDLDNSNTYLEIGRAFLGDFDTTTQGLAGALVFGDVDDSIPVGTPEGVVGKNEREHFFRVTINLLLLESSDRNKLLEIFNRIGAYKHMFVRLDPGQMVYSQVKLGGFYGYFTGNNISFDMRHLASLRYTTSLTLDEAR